MKAVAEAAVALRELRRETMQKVELFLASGCGAALSLIAGTVGMVVPRIVSKHW
jgi:hypothetical protein